MNSFYFVPVSHSGGFENRSLMLVRFYENLDIHATPYKVAPPVEIKDGAGELPEPVFTH